MTTFACVFVQGYVGYRSEYVKRLSSMIKKHHDGPCAVVCLTDQPRAVEKYVDGIVEVQTPPRDYPWWAKVELFKPGRFAGRMCYLDLDVLIWRSLNVVAEYPARFALVPHAGQFNGKNGKAVVKRYNSSVMAWDAGYCDEIYSDFDSSVSRRLWGDQDWIGERMPHERTMPLAWFPRLSEFDAENGQVPQDARVVLCKKPKNREAADRWPWFEELWR